MKKIRIPLLSILLLLNTVAGSAQTFNIPLDAPALDEKAKKMQSIVAVYSFTGQPFEDPVLNGIATKEKPHTFNAILPNLTGAKDTCYAYLYFGGLMGNDKLSGYVFTVITNNTRNAKPCLLWIDRNFNLDLTDDGAPDTFYFNTKHKDIKFENPKVKGAFYTTRISRFPVNYNPKYLMMLDEYYKESSGSKKFCGSTFSFREERLNIRAGDLQYGNDSFRIALKDVNCNGIFNEPGLDVVLTGNYKESVLTDNNIPISDKSGKTFFEKNGKHYDITGIDPMGRSLAITLDTAAKIKNSLVVGKKIKKFRFNSTEKGEKSISIRKFRKKPVYIYVWRFGQNDFDKDTALLREITLRYSDKVSVVTLNYGETPKELRFFKNRSKINWLIGFSSTRINNLLFIENYPTGVLTKKRLRISRVGISPEELLNLLKNNSI